MSTTSVSRPVLKAVTPPPHTATRTEPLADVHSEFERAYAALWLLRRIRNCELGDYIGTTQAPEHTEVLFGTEAPHPEINAAVLEECLMDMCLNELSDRMRDLLKAFGGKTEALSLTEEDAR